MLLLVVGKTVGISPIHHIVRQLATIIFFVLFIFLINELLQVLQIISILPNLFLGACLYFIIVSGLAIKWPRLFGIDNELKKLILTFIENKFRLTLFHNVRNDL